MIFSCLHQMIINKKLKIILFLKHSQMFLVNVKKINNKNHNYNNINVKNV